MYIYFFLGGANAGKNGVLYCRGKAQAAFKFFFLEVAPQIEFLELRTSFIIITLYESTPPLISMLLSAGFGCQVVD
jgi:hypothetical protein